MNDPEEVQADFRSLDDVHERLTGAGYLPDRAIATSVFLQAKLQRPLLVEGPAGTGKTTLAHALASSQGRPLLRIQCYEGIDESRALYEWEYAKQLLYTQILRDRVSVILEGSETLEDALLRLRGQASAFFSEDFLIARPLLLALQSPTPVVLLVDEIDKADPEFEAFLLEFLAEWQVTIPELGTIKAKTIPQVVLTSNRARELSDPLRRRCFHLALDYPSPMREREIIQSHIHDVDDALARAVVGAVNHIRTLDVRKVPSVGEVIDWVRALVVLGRGVVDAKTVEETLGLLVKHELDRSVVLDDVGGVVNAASRASVVAPSKV